jgi:hypothetical protein
VFGSIEASRKSISRLMQRHLPAAQKGSGFHASRSWGHANASSIGANETGDRAKWKQLDGFSSTAETAATGAEKLCL